MRRPCINCPQSRGLGLLQMTELGDTSLVSSVANRLGAAAPYAAGVATVAQGALSGAAIAGLAAWNGKTAWTGALLGASIAGVMTGGAALLAASALNSAGPMTDPQTGETIVANGASAHLAAAGVGAAVIGIGAGIWAAVRINRARRGRR